MAGDAENGLEALTRLGALADECVMCGLCLPHCPTFRLSGLESRSPRGRIALAKGLGAESTIDASIRDALESCLQCRACEAVCPAQVRYGEIIESARAVLHDQSAPRRSVAEHCARSPALTALALTLGGRAARVWPALTRQLGRRARWLLRAAAAVATAPAPARPSVLFTGCLSRAFDSEAQHALLRVAQALVLCHAVRSEAFQTLRNEPLPATVSIGVAHVAQLSQHDSIENLLRDADVALYQAKSRGRDCVMLGPAR